MINEKKKIAVLIDRLNVGGVEKIAIEQVKALNNLGHDAYLVVLRRKGVINDAFLDLRKNLPTIFLDDRLPIFFRYSFKFPVFNFFSFFHITYPFLLPFVVKKNEFRYIIAHGTYTAFTAVAIKKVKKINYSVFIWDPISYILTRVYSKELTNLLSIFIRIAKFLDNIIIKNSDVILTGGSAHNKFIKKINPKAKILTIFPSTKPINKLLNKKGDYILMVTAWKRGKNPEYIFEIIEKIPDIKIKMVGKWMDNKYKRDFQQIIKKRKFSKNIDVVGAVSERELSKFYSKATFLLQTNDDKGFGMPALEAAGHGTTFIIPKGQGVCELFTDTIEGYFTKEKDTKDILKIIKLLTKRKDLAIARGKNAWKKVNLNYSWKIHAEKLINTITKYEK